MNTLTQDLRYYLRQLRRSLGLALTAIVTLVSEVMLRSLPAWNPKQISKVGKIPIAL